jgi:hypothetical protein
MVDGFVKNPTAALRFIFVVAAYPLGTPLSSDFARLAYGAFYFAISLRTFSEIIRGKTVVSIWRFENNREVYQFFQGLN